MATTTIEKKIAQLPKDLRLKAEGYIDALLDEAKSHVALLAAPKLSQGRGYGSLKGKIQISDDFDAPLEEFKDYM